MVQVAPDAYAVVEALRTGVAPTGFDLWAAIWPLAAGLIVAFAITAVEEKADTPAACASVWSRAVEWACSSTGSGRATVT